jgi:uncharacterized membrane protein (DUF4010 family)
LEREKKKQSQSYNGAIGIRTDILISVFGATSMLFSELISPIIFLASFIAILIIGGISYVFNKINSASSSNLKTVISSTLVFLLGALTMLGQFQVAIAISIIVTAILSLQTVLHKTIQKISYDEIIDGMKFLIIAFIVMPFLPNQSYDHQIIEFFRPSLEQQQEISVTKTEAPLVVPTSPQLIQQSNPELASQPEELESDIINPHNIWLLIVIISGIDFLGYILVKLFGKRRGYGLTGMIGGFYSSTVTSLTLSTISKKQTDVKFPFIAGILLACGTSFFKMFVLVRTLNGDLFMKIFPVMATMFLYLMITGGLFHWYAQKKEAISKQKIEVMKLKSPLHLDSAFKIAFIVVLTMIVANLILKYASLNYYYLLAALMAFLAADDPIIISTAGIAGSVITFDIAKGIIIGVIFLNTLQKVATMFFFGNRRLSKYLAFSMVGLFLVTGLAFLYL